MNEKLITLTILLYYLEQLRLRMQSGDPNSIPLQDIGGNIWIEVGV